MDNFSSRETEQSILKWKYINHPFIIKCIDLHRRDNLVYAIYQPHVNNFNFTSQKVPAGFSTLTIMTVEGKTIVYNIEKNGIDLFDYNICNTFFIMTIKININ